MKHIKKAGRALLAYGFPQPSSLESAQQCVKFKDAQQVSVDALRALSTYTYPLLLCLGDVSPVELGQASQRVITVPS